MAMAVETSMAKLTLPMTAATPARRVMSDVSTAPLASVPKIVFIETIATGKTIGKTDSHRGGSWPSSGSSGSLSLPPRGRMGRFMRLSHQRPYSSPQIAAGRATTAPTNIMTPRSIPRFSAMTRGPGVGGTRECVTIAPVVMAQMYLT